MKIHLIDGTYELFRGFYGPPARKAPGGQEVGATIGLLQSLISLLSRTEVTHLACAFDHVIESFRNDLFGGYKTGAGIDPALFAQFTLAEEAVSALGIVVWPMVEFEADDALASAVRLFSNDPQVKQIVICSPDKDLTQLVVKNKIVCWDRQRDILYDEPAVITKYGVSPSSIPDWLALVGDKADGIPGIPGWGAKSAATILREYRHIENIPQLFENWDVNVRAGKRLHENFISLRETALLYRQLTTLRVDVPIKEKLIDLKWQSANKNLQQFCNKLGAENLPARLPEKA